MTKEEQELASAKKREQSLMQEQSLIKTQAEQKAQEFTKETHELEVKKDKELKQKLADLEEQRIKANPLNKVGDALSGVLYNLFGKQKK